MQITPLLLFPLLSSLIAAEQAPLKDFAAGLFDKAKSFIPSGVTVDPIDAGAAKVADSRVERLNIRNFQRKLSPKPDHEEEWVVFITGGNKTCFGRCDPVDLKWNESVAMMTASARTSSSRELHLGHVDCEKDEVLCSAWGAAVPSIYHFLVPLKTEPPSKTPIHITRINVTSITATELADIPSTGKSTYLEQEEYTGLLHPLDGLLAQFNLLIPLGYLLWGISAIPSWMMMLGISMVSRQIMSRRMGNRPGLGAGNVEPPQDPSRPQAAAGAAKAGAKKKN